MIRAEDILTVSRLNRLVSEHLSTHPILDNLTLMGEVFGPKLYPSGHLYFQIKDEAASVSCVMFRSACQGLAFQPKDGDKVVLRARASLYEKDGRFQLTVVRMEPLGRGELFKRFEELKADFEKRGYFAIERKKSIPFLPKRIGVVTSESGAVIHDIIMILRRRFPGFSLRLFPVSVQGENAAQQIAQAISLANRFQLADVLIVGRGGGSMEDLWAFNEPAVIEAIYQSRIPVISAVGHETDFTLCDFVSDLRAATPSAAAELIYPLREDLLKQTQILQDRIRQSVNRRLRRERERLDSLSGRAVLKDPLRVFDLRRQALDGLYNRLLRATQAYCRAKQSRLSGIGKQLDLVNPWAILKRGYAIVRNPEQKVIGTARELNAGAELEILFNDGLASVSVVEVSLDIDKKE